MFRSASLIRSFSRRGGHAKKAVDTVVRPAAAQCRRTICLARQKTPVCSVNKVSLLRQTSYQFSSEAEACEHTKVPLPAMSPTMEMGTIVAWQKRVGDELAEGDLLCEIETDKATMGFETPEEGFLAKILVAEGESDVPVGKLLCIIVANKEDVDKFKDYTPADAGMSAPKAAPKVQVEEAPEADSAADIDAEHTKVVLPAMSPTMEVGTIVSWEKKEGDNLSEGDLLCEIETDKATMGFETPEEGYLAKILVSEGTRDVPVGQLLCIIVPEKEMISAFANYVPPSASKPSKSAPTPTPSPAPSPKVEAAPQRTMAPAPTPVAPTGGRIFVSPLAKKLAAERGINLAHVKGTGPNGRIVAKDLDNVSATPVASIQPPLHAVTSQGDYTDIAVSGIRKVIAQRLSLSKQTIPHYYLSTDISMDKLLSLRTELNESLADGFGIKLSVNDFIIKAASLALKKVPACNSSWQEKFIRQHNNVNINVAVATDEGLFTPVVTNADVKNLPSISSEVRALAEKAKNRKLAPQDFEGGTFTISNLGMFEVKNFSAIVNPPQACILAIGRTETRLVPADNDRGFAKSDVMSVSLSCDHRVVDGAVGAQWLQEFKKNLEKPQIMLLGL